MMYPNPFDFDRSGDLGFSERAFQNEFMSDGFDDEDEEYDSGDEDE